MLLDADIVSIHDLFNGRIQYQIPVYQRHYIWTQDDQWEPLWRDIVEKIKVNAKAETDPQRKPHFTGAIVTQQFIRAVAAIPGYYIIDGQQRLTTFQIILNAISDVCSLKELDDLVELANEYLINSGMLKSREDSNQYRNPNEKYKLLPTQRDKASFDALIDGQANKGQGTIQEAYQFFVEMIEKYMNEKDPCTEGEEQPDSRHRMLNLLDSVLHDFKVVQIVIDADGDSERIFESINARGRTINEFDHLRNNIFLKARVSPENVDERELHRMHWLHFEDDFWTKKLGVDNGEMLESERFLQHFLMAKLKKDSIVHQNLFYKYEREYRPKLAEDREAKFELLELKKYSKVYKILVDCQYDSSEKSEFHYDDKLKLIAHQMEFYKDLRITSLHPFILFIINELEITYKELEKIFKILESYTMRRMLCRGQKISNYSKLFADILISAGSINFDSAVLIRYLLTLKSDEKWPNDDDVRNALARCGDDSFDRSITRYILYRIEIIKASSDSTLRKKLEFSNRLTREHVMPIQWQRYWRLSNSQDTKNVRERDLALQSIGNLTLLTNEFNHELGNQAFSKKRGALLENLDLKLTQEIVYESMNPIQERKTWDVEEIRDREEKLWECFCKELWLDSSSFVVMHLGELENWHPSFTHGFIIDKDGQKIPVKSSEFQHSDIPTLKKGSKVKFEKVLTEDGYKAVNVVKRQ